MYKALLGSNGHKFFTKKEYEDLQNQNLSWSEFESSLKTGDFKTFSRSINVSSNFLSQRVNRYNISFARLENGVVSREKFAINLEMGNIELYGYEEGLLPSDIDKNEVLANEKFELENANSIQASAFGVNLGDCTYQLKPYNTFTLTKLLKQAKDDSLNFVSLLVESVSNTNQDTPNM